MGTSFPLTLGEGAGGRSAVNGAHSSGTRRSPRGNRLYCKWRLLRRGWCDLAAFVRVPWTVCEEGVVWERVHLKLGDHCHHQCGGGKGTHSRGVWELDRKWTCLAVCQRPSRGQDTDACGETESDKGWV